MRTWQLPKGMAPCVIGIVVLVGAICVVGTFDAPAIDHGSNYEYRTWKDITGRYQSEAIMIDFSQDAVRLKKRDGELVTVPLKMLSKIDQLYVKRKADRMRAEAARREPQLEPSGPTLRPDAARREPAAQADWPGWRGPNRDGKSPDRGLLKQWPPEGPRQIWRATGIGQGYSTVAVAGGTVYTTGDVNGQFTIFAFDMDGNRLWQTAHDRAWTKNYPGARSTPVIDGNRLYVVSGHGLVGCYDTQRGQRIWTASMTQFGGSPPNWGYAESVLIFDGLAIVTPGGRNCIVALDKGSGRPAWSSQGFSGGAQYSSCYAFTYRGMPIVTNGTHDGIVAVDPRNGRVLWSNPFSRGNTANCPTPVFSDGYVFWANGYGKGGICLRLTPSGVQQAWTTKDMVCHHGGYIVHEGYIYGNHSNGWACLELSTGRKMWEERAVGKGSVCFADGMLYLFSEKGGRAGLATCSPNGLEMRGTFSVEGSGTSWAHPVVIGGRLYLRYAENLYCFDVRAS